MTAVPEKGQWKDWLAAVAAVLLAIVLLLTYSGQREQAQVLAGIHQTVSHIRTEQQDHQQTLSHVEATQASLKALDNLIVTALAESKHPGEVARSILDQLCRETHGCRIP